MNGMVLCDKSAEMILEREVLGKGCGLEPTSLAALPKPPSMRGKSDCDWSLSVDGMSFNHLHILVGAQNDIRRCDAFAFHVWRSPLPPEATLRIDEPYVKGLYVASGPFLALIAARARSLVGLAQYVMYLCGYYCMYQQEPLKEREPLTKKEDIWLMLKHVKGCMGWRRLARILPYCAEGVRSPQEANFYIVATFPNRFGGYDFTKPEVNASIPLNAEQAQLAGSSEIEVDFYWRDAGVVVEYNGFETHDGGITQLDITQQIILKELGIEVIFVTKEQLYNPALIDLVMQQLAKRLGICPADGWPSMDNVKELLTSLKNGTKENLHSTSQELLGEEKRWIRRVG